MVIKTLSEEEFEKEKESMPEDLRKSWDDFWSELDGWSKEEWELYDSLSSLRSNH